MLNRLDTDLFLFLNGLHTAVLDEPMYWLSDKLIWIPFYAWLAYLLIKQYGKQSWQLFLLIGLIIALCDQTASHIIKPLTERLRPCHEPAIAALVHLSRKGCGGEFGFVSSHAANAFGLAVFIHLTLRKHYRWLSGLIFTWATLVAYSRIYNGVHYPGDVLVAALIGAVYAWGLVALYKKYVGIRIH
jgi:undecaprenyl-diphosphatase